MRNKNIFFTAILIIGIFTYAFNYFASKLNSGIRAYIKGESEYSKGQKDGLLYLFAYMQTEDSTYWNAFNKAINIPISDNTARINMIRDEPDSVVEKNFLAGNNNPNDLGNMMWVFENFRSPPRMEKALNLWISADTLINLLYSTGNKIHDNIKLMTVSEKQDMVRKITLISSQLSKKESAFSDLLNNTARKINRYMLYANVFIGILLLAIVILYAASNIKRLRASELDLTRSVDIIGYQNQRLLNFAYIVSHNIRSYSAHILAAVSLFEDTDSNEEKNELIEDMKLASDRFGETVSHLETLIAVQGQTEVVRESIDLNAYVEKCLGVIVTDTITTHATIHNNIPPGTVINHNPAYMESILLNLLINAIKYRSPDRHPEITLEITGEGNSRALHIKDNGLGIDLRKHGHKLFGMYSTFHNNADARGIGLFIVKYQVEALGGIIIAESEPGKGTTFSVFFSAAKHKK